MTATLPQLFRSTIRAVTRGLRFGAIGLLAVASGVGVWAFLAYRRPGDEVAQLAVPGEAALLVHSGDVLRFTADVDVLWYPPHPDDHPRDCALSLTLTDGAGSAQARCDVYSSGPMISVAAGEQRSSDPSGMDRLRKEGQRVACRFRIERSGTATLRADSTLPSCVPRVLGANLHVFRASATAR
jgi:hypothetical protein